jgi:hypothetical protein
MPTQRLQEYLLRDAVGAQQVMVATEDEFRNRFPECDLGAMPPFGNPAHRSLETESHGRSSLAHRTGPADDSDRPSPAPAEVAFVE